MPVDTQKLLQVAKLYVRGEFPGCKPVEVIIRLQTGEKVRIPVIGKRRKKSAAIEAALEKDPDAMAEAIERLGRNKKKIFDAVPAKDEPPMIQKQIFAKAGLAGSNWNRKKLDELVDEGEISRTSAGYRKTR